METIERSIQSRDECGILQALKDVESASGPCHVLGSTHETPCQKKRLSAERMAANQDNQGLPVSLPKDDMHASPKHLNSNSLTHRAARCSDSETPIAIGRVG